MPMSSDWYDDLENPASGNWAKSSTQGPWYYPASQNMYDDFPRVYATSGTQELWGDDEAPMELKILSETQWGEALQVKAV